MVCGLDAAYIGDGRAVASAVVVDINNLITIEQKSIVDMVEFPYMSGLLSFRELPLLIKVTETLKNRPDLFFVDGQGIAHPRGLGIASHFGVTLNVPTVGVAKKRLIGIYREPPNEKGSWSPLVLKDKTVGCVLRTKSNVKPLFVSPGHLINIEQAREFVLLTTTNYRMCEPIRRAHQVCNAKKRELMQNQDKLKKNPS